MLSAGRLHLAVGVWYLAVGTWYLAIAAWQMLVAEEVSPERVRASVPRSVAGMR